MTVAELPPSERFVHPALFYGTDEQYLDALVPFVTEGLERTQPVAVAVPGARLRLLREALGDAAHEVTMIDMEVAGRNPGRIIPTVLRRFADGHDTVHVRIVGEPIWAGRTDAEYPACAQHEALINLAFAGRDVTIVCPYDTSTLDERALADALVTHPVVWEGARRLKSDRYDPDDVIGRYNQPLPAVSDAVEMTIEGTADLRAARGFAVAHAHRLGLPDERMADLQLITGELVTNSLRHTGGNCRLRVWRHHDHLVCAVEDGGHLDDPLAGRRPPAQEQFGGRGLLLINQLADLVRTHTTRHGTTVHALLALSSQAR
ncbi:anti-sigma regulatory factor [Lentzea pudingi]|uniref:Anti-sigma regulatory factor n=1 Tax=Lentzea pudingi TaxID=1789439 RepID=A0ABQ2HC69_9PSEU|nr:sensor histidine kinase [Lentzea pudingi]GGM75361.1 anti-sigma regulatory factor [Lentzea pudingi]